MKFLILITIGCLTLFSCSNKGECVDCQITGVINGQTVSEGMDFCEDAFQSSQDYSTQKNFYINEGYTCTEQ